jgi:hypothetical protein
VEKSGKWLIVAILAVALAAGAFSWWFRWSATHRAAELWGPEAAATIRDALHIEAYRLTDAGSETDETLVAGNRAYAVERRVDVSKGPGLVHLKQALLEDRSFDWEATFDTGLLVPRWALVFHPLPDRQSTEAATLLFDEDCERGAAITAGQPARPFVCRRIAAGIEKVLTEWLSTN